LKSFLKKERRKEVEFKSLEKNLHRQGYNFIAGVDEAGRGPLAGPVVAAACILPVDFNLPGLNDSKKLAEKKREHLAVLIKEQALAYSISFVGPEEIDLLNILQATKVAMKRALAGLKISPDYVLVDGRDKLEIPIKQEAIIGGDRLIASIAAASILAKVARDKAMKEIHKVFPVYGFDRHKGYGTKFHLEALKKYGPCPIHRRSFSPIKEMVS
jgi:ribonuclease HII